MGKGQNKCTLETGEHNLKATAIFTQASKLKNLFNFKVNCNALSTSIYISSPVKFIFFLKIFIVYAWKAMIFDQHFSEILFCEVCGSFCEDIRKSLEWPFVTRDMFWAWNGDLLIPTKHWFKDSNIQKVYHPLTLTGVHEKSHFWQLGDLCQLDMFSALWPMSVTWCHPEWLFSWSPSLWSSNIHLLHLLCHFHLWHLIYSSSYWGIVTLILKYFCCHSQFPAIYIMFYCAQNWFMSQFQLNMCTFGGLKESQETTIYIFTRYNGAFIQLW